MRTLKRLFYVACTAFLLTSCEETYNDKLFWPGELCQPVCREQNLRSTLQYLKDSGFRIVAATEKVSSIKQRERNGMFSSCLIFIVIQFIGYYLWVS